MKRIILLLGLFSLSAGAWAQKSKVRTAREYLDEGNYRKAIAAIDEAVVNEDTKNSADAWYWRGAAYLQLALDTAAKSPTAAQEATTSFLKALTLNPSYGEEINNPLYSASILAFNEGVADFQTKSYSTAYEAFMRVNRIYSARAGRFGKNEEGMKGLVTNAKQNAAYAALNDKKYDQAVPLLVELKNATTPRDSNVYFNLIEIYQQQHNDAELLATITEARSYFPNSRSFRDHELNYYISGGRLNELMPRLEQAVQQDPHNAELWFNMANGYERMAYPKELSTGKPQPRPANAADYVTKAETAYLNALREQSDNPDYNYNLGVLYYEAAGDFNRQLTDIKGTSPAENKRYKEIETLRDAQFEKALPYFEKAANLLEPTAGSLNESMKTTYRNSLIGLREIYSRKGNKPKTDELQKKIDALK